MEVFQAHVVTALCYHLLAVRLALFSFSSQLLLVKAPAVPGTQPVTGKRRSPACQA